MPTTTTELEPQRSASQLPAYRTAAMLIGIGIGHFVAPKPFDDIVPAELPGDARFYTYASGVAEVGIGAMLLVPRTRRAGAAFAIALFLAVFPANVNMVRLWRDKPLPMKLVALARLPLQVPMITQALAIRRNAPRY
ncbi:DoxX family protein [Mycolicibacterium sphagni]|jgi:uncharacterized membrane protein|uniref:Methylamine utilisation protein MauE domain-containing protein n=1 Tax=Mycolicibacterium sphagni TaxID=1786 RepID=A0A255D8E9_9MYCO|nr:MauE/DoxX family redox-associated membrane protein [Mycolicibacterium sphagni]MCV7177544.1 hypothetical protein [Mycolicibacterium sphagni]OYN75636.1 hypothetical protein CG716_24830 [Mycolicibacterium sphagni]